MSHEQLDYEDEPNRPTRARFVLALWLCGLTCILYIDRICMSQATKPIKEELGLTNTQMSFVMMAFSLAYGLCEVPTGRMGDRYGSRRVLTRIVLWWSVFTALTGACSGLITMMIVRFLFGVGEAGALPNAARVLSRWYPLNERGRVQGVMLGSCQFGAVLAPVGAAYLIGEIGWRWSFSVFGLLGVVWAIGFWWWFRDNPADHSGVNARELKVIQASAATQTLEHNPIPWGKVVRNRGIIVLSLLMILGAFYTYFFYSWFANYLQEARGVSNKEAGTLVSIVLSGSAVGMLFGGWLADQIPKWSANAVDARRYLGVVCYLTASACLFFGIRCDDSSALAALWGASFCVMHITLPNWWSVAIPQCGRHVGALFGLMNGIGVFGAMFSQGFVGVFADWRKSKGYTGREQWDPMFDIYAVGLIISAVVWWCYRYQPLEPEAVPNSTGESS